MFNTTKAACSKVSTELFFPTGTHIEGAVKQAKKICSGCPIAVECLTWAIANEDFGIWGGTTPSERKELRRSPARKNLLLNEMMNNPDR